MTWGHFRNSLCATLLTLTVAPLSASTGSGRFAAYPAPAISKATSADNNPVLRSLREDVTQHPADYVSFETGISANRFLMQHMDAVRETDRRMVQRGILGYWQNKTVVVVPSLSSSNLPGAAW